MQRFLRGLVALLALCWACGGQTVESGTPPETNSPGVAGARSSGAAGSSDAAAGGGGAAAVGGTAGGLAGAATAGNGFATPGDALRSSGCGKAPPREQVTTIPDSRTGYTEFHVTETGATLGADVPADAGPRQFFVRVPVDYDAYRPYRVVYIGQGCGAQGAGKTNTYPLFDERQGGSEQAVYVGLSVPDNGANPGCYDNNSGAQSQEWEAFELIHTFVESRYCVDNNRIYVAGYSSGGWLANMWGCYFAGTPSPPLDTPDLEAGRTQRKFAPHWAIRGHLSVTGSLPPNQPVPCNGPAAGLWIHDQLDKSNLIATNIAALNLSLKSNGCTGDYENGPKQPWAPAEQIPGLQGGICQQYTGCSDDVVTKYPLVFCTTSGLAKSDQSPNAIPAFTQFMNQLDAAP